jgi:hypothetical protein
MEPVGSNEGMCIVESLIAEAVVPVCIAKMFCTQNCTF